MITIEEKLNLFTKIIYDKIQKENENTVKKFNIEFGNLISQKKEEFKRQAEELRIESEKNIKRQKLQIISKARIEEKKIILEKRKEIFNETLENLFNYCRAFTNKDEYTKLFFDDLNKILKELSNESRIQFILTSKDYNRFKDEILRLLCGINSEFIQDDSIIGGFIIINKDKNLKIDMSMYDRILNSREFIGEKLFEAVQ